MPGYFLSLTPGDGTKLVNLTYLSMNHSHIRFNYSKYCTITTRPEPDMGTITNPNPTTA